MNEITVEAKLDSIEQVGEFIDIQLAKISNTKVLQIQINITVEEDYVNIIMVMFREVKN